jgi:hypothetical protein
VMVYGDPNFEIIPVQFFQVSKYRTMVQSQFNYELIQQRSFNSFKSLPSFPHHTSRGWSSTLW